MEGEREVEGEREMERGRGTTGERKREVEGEREGETGREVERTVREMTRVCVCVWSSVGLGEHVLCVCVSGA